MQRLTDRRDFLAAAKAASQASQGVVIQARNRADTKPPRVGFTCTKKLGNAVQRNRTRRRLREAARLTLPQAAVAGFDYVLIGRLATATRGFEALQKDIISALKRIHADGKAAAPGHHEPAKTASD
jgi:ribonuclease P protein component